MSAVSDELVAWLSTANADSVHELVEQLRGIACVDDYFTYGGDPTVCQICYPFVMSAVRHFLQRWKGSSPRGED